MEKKYFGTDENGNEIFQYTIIDKDASISILNYGATIQSLKIKSKKGKLIDVALGFDNLEQYMKNEDRTYFGAVCGRVGNRIADGHFFIDANEYIVSQNNKGNCLHGGVNGFDKKYFELTGADEGSLTFSYFSADGEEGFPGDLSLKVKYTFLNALLLIEYSATTTKTCPVTLTNHTYFNLDGRGDVNTHKLQINSKNFLEIDDNGLAKGEIVKTQGTPLDFTETVELSGVIAQLKEARPTIGGVDHYLFCENAVTDYRKIGTLSNQRGSLKMDIFTNQPGVQVYTGNYIPNMLAKGVEVSAHSGICLEAQFPPNAIEYSHLPSIMLNRDETYYHKTGYKFYFEK